MMHVCTCHQASNMHFCVRNAREMTYQYMTGPGLTSPSFKLRTLSGCTRAPSVFALFLGTSTSSLAVAFRFPTMAKAGEGLLLLEEKPAFCHAN